MAVSFKADVLPLFSQTDIKHMRGMGVLLSDYDWMSDPAGDSSYPDHAHAHHVYARLTGDEQPQMPPGGPYFQPSQLQTIKDWMTVEPTYQP